MKKIAKFIVNGIDHMVNLIALLLVLMTMFLSCYMLWDSNQVYQAADAKNYETYIPTEKHTKSFEELQKINPDVIGWIRVNDTNINYPLLQTDDDDTYMNTDAEGKYSLSGAIFLHCGNKPDFSDFNNIIYGHHMEKEKMFGDIGNFTDETYFDEHPYGNLFFDGKDHGIEFYALMQVDAYNETIFNVCPDTSEAKQAYLLEIIDNALYKRELNITEDDHLVLLTTCTSDMTNGRNVLVGRLTDQVYPEKEKAKNLGTGIDKLKEKMIQVPVIYWILLLELLQNVIRDKELLKSYIPAQGDEITIMTLHKSKGLEFNIVFHMDMYKYIISDEWGDEEQIKQLLNLHYVGVTRAIDACYIMIGTKRYRAKKNDFYKAEPSSFLDIKGLSERRNDVCWK